MYVIYVCMYDLCLYVCMYVWSMFVCMYVCMYVCMIYVCMYVCMHDLCMWSMYVCKLWSMYVCNCTFTVYFSDCLQRIRLFIMIKHVHVCIGSYIHTWCPGGAVYVVIIVSTEGTKDRGFESRQGVRFLGLYTCQCWSL
jgi:hypothetical protein